VLPLADISVPDQAAASAARSAAAAARAAAMAAAAATMGAAGGVKQESTKFGGGGASGAGPSGAGASGAAGPAAADDADDDAVVNAKPVLGMPNEADEACGLCGDVPDEPMRTGCMHWFCRECLLGALPERASVAKCPTCQRPVNAASLLALAPAPSGDVGDEEDDAAPAPASAPAPAKPKPKAKGRSRRGRAGDSDDDTSEEAYQPRDAGAGGDAAGAAPARPRRAAAVKARAAAAEAKKAEAADSDDDEEGGDEDDEAGDDSAGVALPKPAGHSAAASKGKAKAKATAASDPIALRSESKLLVLLKKLKVRRQGCVALWRVCIIPNHAAGATHACRRSARRTSRPRRSSSARRVVTGSLVCLPPSSAHTDVPHTERSCYPSSTPRSRRAAVARVAVPAAVLIRVCAY
jgi:hypothetical protein